MLIYEGFDDDQARAWVRESLSAGHRISAAVLEAVPSDSGRVGCFVPADAPLPLRAVGRRGPHDLDFEHCWLECLDGSKRGAGDDDLDAYVARRAERGDRCIVVEDEMARRGDAWIERETERSFAYFDERLVHYADLDHGLASDVLSDATSGHPTNAFLVRSGHAALGLESELTLGADGIDRIVATLDVVIVAAFDAESYMIWELR